MVLTLHLVQNGAVEQKGSITHKLYIALTSFLGDSCTGENRNSIMHSLCILLTLFLVQNGSVKPKSSNMHKLNIGLTSLVNDFCTSEHIGSIRHF